MAWHVTSRQHRAIATRMGLPLVHVQVEALVLPYPGVGGVMQVHRTMRFPVRTATLALGQFFLTPPAGSSAPLRRARGPGARTLKARNLKARWGFKCHLRPTRTTGNCRTWAQPCNIGMTGRFRWRQQLPGGRACLPCRPVSSCAYTQELLRGLRPSAPLRCPRAVISASP